MYKGIDKKYVREINKSRRKKMSTFQAFNKYILTWKVKLVLACFAGLTAVFYFFTDVNIAVSMYLAFVIALIIIAAIFPLGNEDEDKAKEDLDYLIFFSPPSDKQDEW